MKRIRIRQGKNEAGSDARERLAQCPVIKQRLETGEIIKRGCGLRGLEPREAGWRCFYCGNYVYRGGLELDALWLHFKTGREYWRLIYMDGMDYINGMPFLGRDLPVRLLADLREIHPPRWFAYYLIYDEPDFKRYVELYV